MADRIHIKLPESEGVGTVVAVETLAGAGAELIVGDPLSVIEG
jgi:hypothetical protein